MQTATTDISRNMRGELHARSIIDLGFDRRELHIETSKSAPAPGAWHLESLDRSPARLIDPAGDCAAQVYLTDASRKRTPYSLDRAARIVAALNAANT